MLSKSMSNGIFQFKTSKMDVAARFPASSLVTNNKNHLARAIKTQLK